MRNWMIVWVCLSLIGLASAAEPDAKQQVKPVVAKPSKPKHVVAKHSTKYYYVRATPLPVVSAAAELEVQGTTPKPGEVHTGQMVCELGNFVTVTPDPQEPTSFIVQMKKSTFHMTPVATTTGAVRLEDAQAGAMWLQLPHKSMLMNSKLGQRMADECQSSHQMRVAQAMKLNPPASLLDDPTIAKK